MKKFSLYTKGTTIITILSLTVHSLSKPVLHRFLSKKPGKNWPFILQFLHYRKFSNLVYALEGARPQPFASPQPFRLVSRTQIPQNRESNYFNPVFRTVFSGFPSLVIGLHGPVCQHFHSLIRSSCPECESKKQTNADQIFNQLSFAQ